MQFTAMQFTAPVSFTTFTTVHQKMQVLSTTIDNELNVAHLYTWFDATKIECIFLFSFLTKEKIPVLYRL